MKKIVAFVLGILFLSSLVFSQTSVEINDSFYNQAQVWELRGLTGTLPQLRPYPVNVIKRILNDVIENERIFEKPWSPYFKATGGAKLSNNKFDSESESKVNKDFHTEVGIGGDLVLHELASVGYKFGIYGQKNDFSEHF